MTFTKLMDNYERGCEKCTRQCNNTDCPRTRIIMEKAERTEKQGTMTKEEKERYFELMKG